MSALRAIHSQAPGQVAGEHKDFLVFKLLDERYGVPLLCVREVIERQAIKTVPFAPSYYLGIMNLRGRIVSVVDLARKFGMRREPGPEASGSRSHIIMLDVAHEIIGVLVDQIIGVRKFHAGDIVPNPSVDAVVNEQFILGVTRLDGALTTLVELSKLMDQEELERIRRAKQKEEKERG